MWLIPSPPDLFCGRYRFGCNCKKPPMFAFLPASHAVPKCPPGTSQSHQTAMAH